MRTYTVGIRKDSYITMEVQALTQAEAVTITEDAIKRGLLPVGVIVDTRGTQGCVYVDTGRKPA